MKLTFLGTGAGEGYPGYWCRCPHCEYARSHGGKNLRSHSCAVLDGRILLDLSPTSLDRAARMGLDLTQCETLLITHPHEDHLYPILLRWREGPDAALSLPYREQLSVPGPRFSPIPTLQVYGNEAVLSCLRDNLPRGEEAYHLRLHAVREGESFYVENGSYGVTPVRGRHGDFSGFAHSYVIRHKGKTMLYALDTGLFEEDQLELLSAFVFDLVVMEGTTGLNEQRGGHMCLETNRQMLSWLRQRGCLREGAPFVLTHLSPHWCPPHDWYESIVSQAGLQLAYDGMEIEF